MNHDRRIPFLALATIVLALPGATSLTPPVAEPGHTEAHALPPVAPAPARTEADGLPENCEAHVGLTSGIYSEGECTLWELGVDMENFPAASTDGGQACCKARCGWRTCSTCCDVATSCKAGCDWRGNPQCRCS